MKYFIFRNTTIENVFGNNNFSYSGYDDILNIDAEADIFIWFYLLPVKSNIKALVIEIDSYFNSIQLIYQKIPANKMLLVFTLQNINQVKYINNDFSVQLAINAFNTAVIELANHHANIKVIDFSDFIQKYPSEQLIDWKYYFISKMQLSPKLAKPFRVWFKKQIEAIQFIRKKCLVLDLDNTIWGGILGEDGINGIKIGGDYPGNAFSMFQQNLLELSGTGVILAVCSKNNEQDVLELWEKNTYLTLKKEHFAAYRINWNNKADNIKELAGELNIGLDSFVFADDNPSERELVKQLLPMVEVPDFPEQPYLLPVFFDTLLKNYFSVYTLTEEDKAKTAQYKSNVQRASVQKSFTDFSEYLASLAIVITIQKADSLNCPRIAQMTQKTNQFNLTTFRYDEAGIRGFMNNEDPVFCISVRDKFGDSGITGAIILKNVNEDTVDIDSLLLSCRILGKGIEKAFLFQILTILKKQGINTVLANYIPTVKNVQVKDFYETAGFILIGESNGTKQYQIDLQNTGFTIETHYKIEMQ